MSHLKGKIPQETIDTIIIWLKYYAFKDLKEVYTDCSTLVPLFRVRQALENYNDGNINQFTSGD